MTGDIGTRIQSSASYTQTLKTQAEKVRQQEIETHRSFLLFLNPWWNQHQPGFEPLGRYWVRIPFWNKIKFYLKLI